MSELSVRPGERSLLPCYGEKPLASEHAFERPRASHRKAAMNPPRCAYRNPCITLTGTSLSESLIPGQQTLGITMLRRLWPAVRCVQLINKPLSRTSASQPPGNYAHYVNMRAEPLYTPSEMDKDSNEK